MRSKQSLRLTSLLVLCSCCTCFLCGLRLVQGPSKRCERDALLTRPASQVSASSETAATTAYEYWTEQFLLPATSKEFCKRPATEADISKRVLRLRAALGSSETFVLKLLAKDASILFAPRPRASFLQLGFELTGCTSQGRGAIMSALLEKPALLLLPPKVLAKKGTSALDLDVKFPEAESPSDDEPSYWSQERSSRNAVMELGKLLKPVGGAKAVYPVAFALLYLAAWTSEYLNPRPPV